jgi:MYM-type Zinc finger with FCS sequence motif
MILISVEQMLNSPSSFQVPLKCDACQVHFTRIQKRVKSLLKCKSQIVHFCSKKCQSSFQKKTLVQISCSYCKKDFWGHQSHLNRRAARSKSSYLFCSKTCASKNNTYRSKRHRVKVSESLKKRYQQKLLNAEHVVLDRGYYRVAKVKNICVICSKVFFHCKPLQSCSKQCLLEISRRSGTKGGLTTSTSPFQKRSRSNNERNFFQKILNLYPDALHNKRMFDGYDADIIIPSKKIAIHWNGIWHYQKVITESLLHKIQKKDELRYASIARCGYINYIIKDLGVMNKEKVDHEYINFINYIQQSESINKEQ